MTAMIAVAIALTACSDRGTGPAGASGSPALLAVQAASLPETVDALPGMDPEQYQRLLTELKGTPAVVNLWASWCEPCKAEAPMLSAAASENPDVQFLGVNVLDSREGAERFIAEYAIPYPSVFDPDAAIRTDLASFGLPVTVFYSADGAMVAKVDGELSQQTLDEDLAAIEPTASS